MDKPLPIGPVPNSEKRAQHGTPGDAQGSDPAAPEHSTVRRETQDIWFGWLVVILIGVGCAAVTDAYVVWQLFGTQNAQEAAEKASEYPLATDREMGLPVRPRLEQLDRVAGDKRGDAGIRERANLEILARSGPSDEQGFVHIPIDEAMKLIVSQLPVRAPHENPRDHRDRGLRDRGEPNSGRIFQGATP